MTLARSCGPEWLDSRLSGGAPVMLDGAMGTELQARGVPMHSMVWSAAALMTHPDAVCAAHADYIRAGAEVIITNTFAAGRHMLEPAGLGDQVKIINRRAVELAKRAREEAAETPVAIAGSICEWVHSDTAWREPDKLFASLREQAMLLAEAGVDLIALEMCERPTSTSLAVEAALETGLPVWVGISCRRNADSGRLVSFDPPHGDVEELITMAADREVAVINVMHSPIQDTAAGISAVRRHWTGPVGVYPESGYFIMPNWQFVDVIDPTDLVREARTWVDQGVQLLGGCCGLGPQHVRALKRAFA